MEFIENILEQKVKNLEEKKRSMKEKITKIYDNQFDPDYIRDKLTDTEDTVRRNIIRVD